MASNSIYSEIARLNAIESSYDRRREMEAIPIDHQFAAKIQINKIERFSPTSNQLYALASKNELQVWKFDPEWMTHIPSPSHTLQSQAQIIPPDTTSD